MRRWFRHIVLVSLAGPFGLGAARAATTPPDSAAPQPSLPQPVSGVMPLSSPILGGGSSDRTGKPLVVRKKVKRTARGTRRHRYVERYDHEPLDRPALAGVQLLAPIPNPIQPPHFMVPVPAYPLENFVTFYTTPPPPVICHRVPRDPNAPDPHLLYEKPVVCEADNP